MTLLFSSHNIYERLYLTRNLLLVNMKEALVCWSLGEAGNNVEEGKTLNILSMSLISKEIQL
jgi:hypothetical protein